MNQLDVRIYYEDTDHSGLVYHANYLKFMERGRTESLRKIGFNQVDLAKDDDVIFALSRTDIHYIRPAYFDDLITVDTKLLQAKGAKLVFKQRIYRQDTLLVEGDMVVVCVSRAGRPKRIPKSLLARIDASMEQE